MIAEPLTDEEEREGFVVNSPPGTFSDTLKRKRVLDESFSLETQYLGVKDSDRNLVGIRPFAILKKAGLSKVLDCLPESHFAGIRIHLTWRTCT